MNSPTLSRLLDAAQEAQKGNSKQALIMLSQALDGENAQQDLAALNKLQEAAKDNSDKIKYDKDAPQWLKDKIKRTSKDDSIDKKDAPEWLKDKIKRTSKDDKKDAKEVKAQRLDTMIAAKISKPRDRKGDYVIVGNNDSTDTYNKSIIAQLIRDPYKDEIDNRIDPGLLDRDMLNTLYDSDSSIWFIDFIAQDNKTKRFYEAEAEWYPRYKEWFTRSMPRIRDNVKAPRNWNPPKKLLKIASSKNK